MVEETSKSEGTEEHRAEFVEAPALPGVGYHIKEATKGVGGYIAQGAKGLASGLTSRKVLPVVTLAVGALGVYALKPVNVTQGNLNVDGYELTKFTDQSGEYILTNQEGQTVFVQLPEKNAFKTRRAENKVMSRDGTLEQRTEENFLDINGPRFTLSPVTATAEPVRVTRTAIPVQ